MTVFAAIDISTNKVVNRIVAEPGFELEGHILVADEVAQIGWTWDGEALSPPAVPFADLKIAKLDAVKQRMEAELATGAPVDVGEATLHIALDDGSRADMTGMAATALAAATGAVPWPSSYQAGWITIENARIPLPTPAEGLGIAAFVGDRYAQIRQHGRDLKDAVLAAEDAAALDAIDIDAGWPG